MGWAIGDATPLGPKKVRPVECFRYLDNQAWTLRVGREPPLDLKGVMVAIMTLAGSLDVDHHFEVETPE
jgi:hypothetical protein